MKLLRFVEPQPQRSLGLAWRPTSTRKAGFLELGQNMVETERRSMPPAVAPPMSGGVFSHRTVTLLTARASGRIVVRTRNRGFCHPRPEPGRRP